MRDVGCELRDVKRGTNAVRVSFPNTESQQLTAEEDPTMTKKMIRITTLPITALMIFLASESYGSLYSDAVQALNPGCLFSFGSKRPCGQRRNRKSRLYHRRYGYPIQRARSTARGWVSGHGRVQ